MDVDGAVPGAEVPREGRALSEVWMNRIPAVSAEDCRSQFHQVGSRGSREPNLHPRCVGNRAEGAGEHETRSLQDKHSPRGRKGDSRVRPPQAC